MAKVAQGLDRTGAERLAVGGGVAANSELRERLRRLCGEREVALKIPAPRLCTDNAAMIACAARFAQPVPYPDYLAFDAFARRDREAALDHPASR
jgi:N6-L-threonylcarbamoyladenine synthase